mgnify:CR=1 FL=1
MVAGDRRLHDPAALGQQLGRLGGPCPSIAPENTIADDRDDEQSDIHLLDGKSAPRAPDQIAQPAFRPHHLRDCDQHEPDADPELVFDNAYVLPPPNMREGWDG